MKKLAFAMLLTTFFNLNAFAFENKFEYISAKTALAGGIDLGRSAIGYAHLTVKGDFSLGENEIFVSTRSCLSSNCGWSVTGPFNSPGGRDTLKDGVAHVYYTNIKTQLGYTYQIGIAKCQTQPDGVLKGMIIANSCESVSLSPAWEITRKGVEILN